MTTNQQLIQFAQSARLTGIRLDELLFNLRREYILDTLRDNRANISKSAKELGMHRNTLTHHMEELNINFKEVRLEVRAPKRGVHSVRPNQETARMA